MLMANEEKERKSLREMAAETQKAESESGRGIRCPQCDYRDSRVPNTWPGDEGGFINRQRVCRYCGCRFHTVEQVV